MDEVICTLFGDFPGNHIVFDSKQTIDSLAVLYYCSRFADGKNQPVVDDKLLQATYRKNEQYKTLRLFLNNLTENVL